VTAPADREDLVLSIRDVAKMFGVSDDLVYELVARDEIPCLRLGRRRLIPRRAVELMIERSLEAFDFAGPTGALPVSAPGGTPTRTSGRR
jgi:excisionase family DNA binding protein